MGKEGTDNYDVTGLSGTKGTVSAFQDPEILLREVHYILKSGVNCKYNLGKFKILKFLEFLKHSGHYHIC